MHKYIELGIKDLVQLASSDSLLFGAVHGRRLKY